MQLSRPVIRKKAIISLTPLIDVVFILLIFFMLASSFSNQGVISVSTPAVGISSSSTQNRILIDISDSQLLLNGVESTDLRSDIEAYLVLNPQQQVALIRPARGVTLQDTIEIVELLTSLDVPNISFAASAD